MIHGIGTDIVAVKRLQRMWERHGQRIVEKLLAPQEVAEFTRAAVAAKGRFLAKRFAAKEAFGKALGTGVAVPATLHAVAVGHDSLGKPRYVYDERLTLHMENNCLRAHLSITDEDDTVVAFAVIEQA